MSEHTFPLWLHSEVAAARYALLTLYEQRDKLLYIDRPQLEKEYMDAVGSFEETVIKEEIELELLQKKQQMIQTALNRREPVDESAIDAALELERQKLLSDASGPIVSSDHADLSPEQSEKLQELYRDIVKNFHPQMHPELTDAHRELYQKAQEAYRRGDLAALKLVHEMLYSTVDDGMSIEMLLELLKAVTSETQTEETPRPRDYATDYTLAAQIYSCFKPTSEEAAIQEERTRYRQMSDSVMAEMEHIRQAFPFTAADMLSSPEKIEDYKESLSHRLHTAKSECHRLTQVIKTMMEGIDVCG